MPVMPGYLHVDTPHERTVAGPGYRYGCHSDTLGPIPRGRRGIPAVAQDGWTEDGRRRMVDYTADWIEMPCGHTTRATDDACAGCSNATPLASEQYS